MFTRLILGAAIAVACPVPTEPTTTTEAPPTTTTTQAMCTTDHGYMDNGRLVVTVLRTETVPCDLVPPQLNLVWNAETEGPDWGSDASVERATTEALDAGCDLRWYNDGEYRLVGENCDF
jgi:hypothetical protein